MNQTSTMVLDPAAGQSEPSRAELVSELADRSYSLLSALLDAQPDTGALGDPTLEALSHIRYLEPEEQDETLVDALREIAALIDNRTAHWADEDPQFLALTALGDRLGLER